MKALYFFLGILMLAALYVRFVNPDAVDTLFQTNAPKSQSGAAAANPPSPTQSDSAPPESSPTSPPVPPKGPSTEVITPETTAFINSQHVVDVPQPKQPSADSETNPPASSPSP